MKICKKIYAPSILFLVLLSIVSVHAQVSPLEKDQILKIGCMNLTAMCEIDEYGNKSGILYELYKEIAIRAGLKHEFKFLPFGRTLTQLNAGKIDMTAGGSDEEALLAGDNLTYLFSTNWIIVVSKDSGIQTLEDLRGKNLAKVGTRIEARSPPELEGIFKNIYGVRDFKQSMQMLDRRSEVDAILLIEQAYPYFLRTLNLNPQSFKIILDYKKPQEQWVSVNRNMPKETRNKIEKAVEEIRKEKIIEKIFNKYGYTIPSINEKLLN